MEKKKYDELFIMESELTLFRTRHPEYNTFRRVYDENNVLAGYVASVEDVDKNDTTNGIL